MTASLYAAAIVVTAFSSSVALAQSGTIAGRVTDSQTDEPLPGATVRVAGTALGSASDLEGSYRIAGAPAGEQTLIVSYVGYENQEIQVQVVPGQMTTQDIALVFGVLQGQEVVVTAQLEGQARAINQQLSSETITNVVSSERIQELPDANAAESVGRLPGVSVQRSGGEGQKVVIRGLSPRFSSVTVNGERIPSTGTGRRTFIADEGGSANISPDVDDRSVDLAMISPDALAGIEVSKALTPDMDADAIGGTVNFVTRRAPDGLKGRINLQTAYSGLRGQVRGYDVSAYVSDRFMKNKLGYLFSGGIESADRSNHNAGTDYKWSGFDPNTGNPLPMAVNAIGLTHRIETRARYNANLALDFEPSLNHIIVANALYGRTQRDWVSRGVRYQTDFNYTGYSLSEGESEITLFSSSLRGEHLIPFAKVNWRGNYATTWDETPWTSGYGFQEPSTIPSDVDTDKGPWPIPPSASFDPNNASGGMPWMSRNKRKDANWSGQVDVEVPYSIGSTFAGRLQFGGKYAAKDRSRRNTGYGVIGVDYWAAFRADHPDANYYTNNSLRMTDFIQEDFDPDDFMKGDFPFVVGLKEGPREIWEQYSNIFRVHRGSANNDYNALETATAGYGMVRIDAGPRLMLLGGVRYEYSDNEYEAKYIRAMSGTYGERGTVIDTTSNQTYGYFFPQAHARYRFFDGLDLRLAVTRSMSRPDFHSSTPYEEINTQFQYVVKSNPDLKPTLAWNYDAFLSVYNRLGLLTVGAYYKTLEGVDYLYRRQISERGNPLQGYNITAPYNVEEQTTVKGIETEVQTNLRFLPSPFNGIVLYGNYSRIWSETPFPYQVSRGYDPVTFAPIFADTSRVLPMPGQSDHIANVAVGYEKGGFSGRLSLVYQGRALDVLGAGPELDNYTDDFTRWDLALSQRVYRYVTLFVNVTNLTNLTERSFVGGQTFPTSENLYGWQTNIGVRFNY